jgi:hypothetical protein
MKKIIILFTKLDEIIVNTKMDESLDVLYCDETV